MNILYYTILNMADKAKNKAYQRKHMGLKGSRTPEQQANWREHNKRRLLRRAMLGENVSYATLRENGMLTQLADINKARAELNPPKPPIEPRLIDNLNTAEVVRAGQEVQRLRTEVSAARENEQEFRNRTVAAQSVMTAAMRHAGEAEQAAELGRIPTTLTTEDNRIPLPPNSGESRALYPEQTGVSWNDIVNFFRYVYSEYENCPDPCKKGLDPKVRRVLVNRTYDGKPEDQIVQKYPAKGWEVRFKNHSIENIIKLAGCERGNDRTLLTCLTRKVDKAGKEFTKAQYKKPPAGSMFRIIYNLLAFRFPEGTILKGKDVSGEPYEPNTLNTKAMALGWMLERYPNLYEIRQLGPEGLPLGPQLIELHKALVELGKEKSDEATAESTDKAKTEGEQVRFQVLQDFVDSTAPFNDIKKDQAKLYFALYKEVPVREDFNSTKIIYNKPSANQLQIDKEALLYLPPKGECCAIFYLNKYKTQEREGSVEYKLSPQLTTLIWDTLAEKPREYLFLSPARYSPKNEGPPPKTGGTVKDAGSKIIKPVLAEFKKKYNKKVRGKDKYWIEAATDYLRKAVIGEAYSAKPELSEALKIRLAKRMLHAVATAKVAYSKHKVEPFTINKNVKYAFQYDNMTSKRDFNRDPTGTD